MQEIVKKMKRKGYLFERITSVENIREAIERSARNKHHRREVRAVVSQADRCAREIHELLVSGSWSPAPYRHMVVRDSLNKKERLIKSPKYMPDLIIQWAIMLQLEPLFNRGLYRHAYCNVKGRGSIAAAKYVKRCLRDVAGTKYCLKMDIAKYYDNVDGSILKGMYRRVIKCERTLSLLDAIVDSVQGIPIGNYTSQIFANFYLQGLDDFIKQELGIKYYARYMDDMVLLGSNKRKLHACRKRITRYLKTIKLKLNRKWQVFPVASRRVDFCGLASNHKNSHIRRTIFGKLLKNVRRLQRGIYTRITAARYMAYNGWVVNSDSSYLQAKYLLDINLPKIKHIIQLTQ